MLVLARGSRYRKLGESDVPYATITGSTTYSTLVETQSACDANPNCKVSHKE